MLNTTHLIVLVGLISSGLALRDIDFRQLPTPRVLTAQTCSAPGLMCKDCTTVQSCVSNGPGNTDFTATPIQTCNSTSVCLNGACVANTDLNPFCNAAYDTFECPDYGIFPDPAYCKKFHMCVPSAGEGENSATITLTLTTWECETGFGYNARTKVCDKKLINNQCPAGYPVPLCRTPGQTAPVPENPSIYYICGYRGETDPKVLYPNMQTCKNGKTYNSRFGCQ